MNRPMLGFSPGTFARRRARVMEELGGGALVLPAAPPLYRSRDTELRYRPDTELFYLTGCTDPGVVAVLRDAEEDRFVLFVPRQDPKSEIWVGPRHSPEEAGELYGVDSVHPAEELSERLPDLLKDARRLFFRLGAHPDLESMVVGAMETARRRGQRKGEGPRAVVDPGEILDELRLFKDSEEITRLRRAANLTVEAFRAAMGGTHPGMGEWDVEAILEGAFRTGGGWGPGFPTIVGAGPNGCILHYTANQGILSEGELVLVDGGGEVDLYSGDVTRTYPSNGRFTDSQKEVYGVVRRAHAACLAQVRPGTPVSAVHEAALAELTSGLVALGVLGGEVPELVSEKAYEPFFPHQTSHWLGLDIHDVGDYAREGRSRVLEPGMVLTIEPGLYLSEKVLGAGHPLAGLGVRLEDDLLVTEGGVENLTEELPVELEEVESLVGVG